MTEKIIEKFEIKHLQVLDESGKIDKKLMPKIEDKLLKEMYSWMVKIRAFDEKALKLQRQGRIGTYAQMKGQEACQVGSASCIKNEDLIFPAFRENGVFMMRGMPAEMLYRYWAGDERGMQIPEKVNMFPISITVGAHPPHAVGAAMAFKYLKKKAATMTYFGDGATSEGDFHTAMNFAGAFKAPVVFVCQNNQWAISLPVKEQTAAETIAQKAIAYGFEGVRVDGNDVLAVYKATQVALEKARKGGGPTLIECLTYRVSDHTTSDDAKKYRKESEVKKWEAKDPILRFRKYLMSKKLLTETEDKKIFEDAQKYIDDQVLKAESVKLYPIEEITKYMFAEMTPELKEQQAKLITETPKLAEKTTKVSKPSEKGGGVVGELEEAPEEKSVKKETEESKSNVENKNTENKKVCKPGEKC